MLIAVACIGLRSYSLHAQARGGTPQTGKVQPVNAGADPYRVIRDWAHIEGRAWGGSKAVTTQNQIFRLLPTTHAARGKAIAPRSVVIQNASTGA